MTTLKIYKKVSYDHYKGKKVVRSLEVFEQNGVKYAYNFDDDSPEVVEMLAKAIKQYKRIEFIFGVASQRWSEILQTSMKDQILQKMGKENVCVINNGAGAYYHNIYISRN